MRSGGRYVAVEWGEIAPKLGSIVRRRTRAGGELQGQRRLYPQWATDFLSLHSNREDWWKASEETA